MSDEKEIKAGHPLLPILRNGLLWHRTSTKEYRQIRADGFIKPNDGRVNRWGGQYACQQLGGISLFDFTTHPEPLILGEAIKWQQFLGDAGPVTVILGVDKNRLQSRVIPYPANKEGTTGNVIPWVEVCHCGPISVSAVVCYLLVCSFDYKQFSLHQELDEQTLIGLESEYGRIVSIARERGAKHIAQLNEKIRAVTESSEFKARMARAKRIVGDARKQN